MLLLTLVFGMIEFGYAFYTQGTLAGAAREGVRHFVIHGDAATARQRAVDAAPGTGLAAGEIAISPSSCPTTAPTPGSDPLVTVTISHPYSGLTGFFTFFDGYTMTATGSMRCSG